MLFEKEIRKLGFGLMRLPKKDNVIDIEQVKEMTDRFMEAGFTYFDTAWAYEGSEEAVRQALVERYPRESFQLATKNAAWIQCKTREDAIAQFETSLAKTGAGYFDCYLLHNLGEHRTRVFDDFKLWDFVKEKKAEGKIRHYGFSFHSTPEELDQILTAHPDAEFVQLQINYADWENPAIQSRGVYEVARQGRSPGEPSRSSKGDLKCRGSFYLRRLLGDPFRRGPGGDPGRSLRYERPRPDGGQSLLHEGFHRLHKRAERGRRKGPHSPQRHPSHPLHHLQLLCQSMSEKYRDLRHLHSL